MKKHLKKVLFCMLFIGLMLPGHPCTGISLKAGDGSQILARTIEWGGNLLPSQYVIIPRGHALRSLTPTGANGLSFTARHGIVGLSVVESAFITEGINEKGLSAGLFYFPHYGEYVPYDSLQNDQTLVDLQVVSWILTQFATIEEVKQAIEEVRIVQLDPRSETVHWRIGEPSGKQVVLEIVDGVPHFYDNPVGVLTNSPGFPWHLTHLNNFVNLFPGGAPTQTIGEQTLAPFGAGSGFLGIPGDVTPPSRFVRAAFYQATAPQRATAHETVLQCFQILNNFDIPIGVEFAPDQVPSELNSATQWTTATDLSNLKLYYRTAWNSTIRCIDLQCIRFDKVSYQAHPLDKVADQPIEQIRIR